MSSGPGRPAGPVRDGALIAVCGVLILLAYVPTLLHDYVTHDQLRAFRYSFWEETAWFRGTACARMIPAFYVLTGRPLVWMTECLEHAAVGRIEDFAYLRPVVLLLTILVALGVGRVVGRLLGSWPLGTIAASAMVVAPGYSFMHLQGLPAAMVLLCVPMAAYSFELVDRAVSTGPERSAAWSWIAGLGLFLASCMIYPAWAFVVVVLSLLQFGLHGSRTREARVRCLVLTLGSFILGSIVYYAIVKTMVAGAEAWKGYVPDLGEYQVAMALEPSIVWERLLRAGRFFLEVPPLNFPAPPGVLPATVGIFSLRAAWSCRKTGSPMELLGSTILISLLTAVALCGAISPWLFSQMPPLETRHVLPWYLFAPVVWVSVVSSFPLGWRRLWAPACALVLILLPASIAQYRLSSLEVAVSSAELQYIRGRLDEWLNLEDDRRLLLLVRPTRQRPEFAESVLGDSAIAGENAKLVTAQPRDAEVIPWLIGALLRERSDHPSVQSVGLIDCAFDELCVRENLQLGHVVLSLTDGGRVGAGPHDPFVVDPSLLTAEPTRWFIEKHEIPSPKPRSPLPNATFRVPGSSVAAEAGPPV